MTARIQFREEQMREAIAAMRKSAKEFREVVRELQRVSKIVDDGALEGRAGIAMSASIRNTACPRIEQLAQKLEEQARFAEQELEQMKKAASQLR
jgi:response regulator RpfG family c-di-GMP phosphodiesterase